MTLKLEPYQAPELILLGGSAKDTANPTQKDILAYEFTTRYSSYGWVHGGPNGRPGYTHVHERTQHVS